MIRSKFVLSVHNLKKFYSSAFLNHQKFANKISDDNNIKKKFSQKPNSEELCLSNRLIRSKKAKKYTFMYYHRIAEVFFIISPRRPSIANSNYNLNPLKQRFSRDFSISTYAPQNFMLPQQQQKLKDWKI